MAILNTVVDTILCGLTREESVSVIEVDENICVTVSIERVEVIVHREFVLVNTFVIWANPSDHGGEGVVVL